MSNEFKFDPKGFEYPAGDRMNKQTLLQTAMSGVEIPLEGLAITLARLVEAGEETKESVKDKISEELVNLCAQVLDLTEKQLKENEEEKARSTKKEEKMQFEEFDQSMKEKTRELLIGNQTFEVLISLAERIPDIQGKQDFIDQLLDTARRTAFSHTDIRELAPDFYPEDQMNGPMVFQNIQSAASNMITYALQVQDATSRPFFAGLAGAMAYMGAGFPGVVGVYGAFLCQLTKESLEEKGLKEVTTLQQDMQSMLNGTCSMVGSGITGLGNVARLIGDIMDVCLKIRAGVISGLIDITDSISGIVMNVAGICYQSAMQCFGPGSSVSSASSNISNGTVYNVDLASIFSSIPGSIANNPVESISDVLSQARVDPDCLALVVFNPSAVQPIKIPGLKTDFNDSQEGTNTPIGVETLRSKKGADALMERRREYTLRYDPLGSAVNLGKRKDLNSGGRARKSRRYKKKKATLKRRGLKRRRTRKGKKRRHTKKR